jgi:hypothetical protein
MLEPLSDAERKVLMDMLERVKTWVQTGYSAEVNNRHPDAVSGK